jgi:ATP-binding cassette subfamily F protein 3
VAGADKEFEGTAVTGYNVTQTFFAQHQLESVALGTRDIAGTAIICPKTY